MQIPYGRFMAGRKFDPAVHCASLREEAKRFRERKVPLVFVLMGHGPMGREPSYRGIPVDLRDFDLIDPCGMPGIPSTSIAKEAGWQPAPPATGDVERAARVFAPAIAARFGAELVWDEAGALALGAA